MIIDISLPLNDDTPIYPGNPDIHIQSIRSSSGTSTHSQITLGSHTGTHIDAPNHVLETEKGIDSYSLDHFYGTCRVIDATTEQPAISRVFVEQQNITAGERILFKTNNSARGFKSFYEDYIFLDPDAAEYLSACNVMLVGIDSLSIKQKGARDNRAHTSFLQSGIPILEGLNLVAVEAGTYILIAFPLAFTLLDGCPVRAVLVS